MDYIKKFVKPAYKSEKANIRQVVQIFDEKTGEIKKEYETLYTQRKSKRGWCRMYAKDYGEAMRSISHNRTAIDLWFYFLSNGFFKKDGTIKPFNQTKIAKELGYSRPSVNKAVRVLKENELIAKVSGEEEYRYNPFIQGIANQSDEEIALAQDIWEREIGYYDYYKDNQTRKD